MREGIIVLNNALELEYATQRALPWLDIIGTGIKNLSDEIVLACKAAQIDMSGISIECHLSDKSPRLPFDIQPTEQGFILTWPTEATRLYDHFKEKLQSTEDLLKAISIASGVLVGGKEIGTVLSECLAIIGQSLDIDRLSIYRCHPHSITGQSAYSLRARWCGPNLPERNRITTFNDNLWDPELTFFRQMFEIGELVSCQVKDLSDIERSRLEEEGRKALLTTPIFVDNTWWGVITFDQFISEHEWTSAELAGIQILANNIGGYIHRRRTIASLEQNEELHRTIIDNTKDLIYSILPSGDLIFTSASLELCLGYHPDLVLGMSLFDFMHPDDRKNCHMYIDSIIEDPRNNLTFDFRASHADGTWRHLSTSASAVRNEEGYAELIVGIAKDITERIQYEEKLENLNSELSEARDRALESSLAKSQFLANMSHEIRTPLNGVLGMTSLLLEKETDAETYDMLSTIKSSGEMLLRVINDILDFSKIEAGKMSIECTNLDLEAVINDIYNLNIENARTKGIGFKRANPESKAPIVRGDPTRLRQVLGNIVSNAIKFTQVGEVNLSWDWEIVNNHVVVNMKVKDTGVGIPNDKLESVFDRFTQAESSTHRMYGGTGLGLAICRKLSELMGGSVEVQSAIGQGSLFTMHFSFEIASIDSFDDRTATGSGDYISKHLRILLAEDNPINVKVACHLLRKCGCLVDVANDGNEAVRLSLSNDYNIIFMDMEMPTCSGIEATRLIRESESEGKKHRIIIALTANALTGDKDACLEAGMDDFLAKPISLDSLRQTLQRYYQLYEDAA